MKLLRLLRFGVLLAVSRVISRTAGYGTAGHADSAPIEDPASYLHVEVHVGAHRQTVNITPEQLAQAHREAESYWAAHYAGLAEELAAVTRRHMLRRRQVA